MPRLTLIPNKIFIFAFVWVFILPLVYYFFQAGEGKYLEHKDKKSLPFVKSIHLNEATIAGTNIPPVPNEAENNATLLGVDSNKNYIRDDVELAIYAKYASSTQERVALLGYAQALEMRYRVSWKEGHQYVEDVIDSYQTCLWETLNPITTDTQDPGYFQTEAYKKRNDIIDSYDKVVSDDIIFNTKERKDYIKESNKAFLSYGGFSFQSRPCQLDFNKVK